MNVNENNALANLNKPSRLVRVDLHNHLKTGSVMSGENFFNSVINKAYQNLGDNFVIGLINFEDSRYEDFIKLQGYERQYLDNSIIVGVNGSTTGMVLKGQEIPTEQGHILALGLRKDHRIKGYRSLDETLKDAKKEGCIIVADHPCYKEGTSDYLISNENSRGFELIKDFDAIETFNGEAELWLPGFSNANGLALELYECASLDDLGAIASSDGHTVKEVGRNYTYLFLDKSIEELRDAEDVQNVMRNAIRNATPKDQHKRSGAPYGFLHLVALGGYITQSKIQSKIGKN